jgi:hypothetical protein
VPALQRQQPRSQVGLEGAALLRVGERLADAEAERVSSSRSISSGSPGSARAMQMSVVKRGDEAASAGKATRRGARSEAKRRAVRNTL